MNWRIWLLLLISLANINIGMAQDEEHSYPETIDWSGLTNVADSTESLESLFEPEDKILMVIFNPGCGHCQDFIDTTKMFYDSLSEYKFLFVLVDHPDILGYFNALQRNMNLNAYDRFYYAKAENPFFEPYWIQHIPALYYYGAGEDHKFLKFIDVKDQSYDYFLNAIKTED